MPAGLIALSIIAGKVGLKLALSVGGKYDITENSLKFNVRTQNGRAKQGSHGSDRLKPQKRVNCYVTTA
jgi:hypothetical protein